MIGGGGDVVDEVMMSGFCDVEQRMAAGGLVGEDCLGGGLEVRGTVEGGWWDNKVRTGEGDVRIKGGR